VVAALAEGAAPGPAAAGAPRDPAPGAAPTTSPQGEPSTNRPAAAERLGDRGRRERGPIVTGILSP
jgi:hypothetical protein